MGRILRGGGHGHAGVGDGQGDHARAGGRACQLQLAAAVQYSHFHLKHFASYARPCKSVYDADFSFLIYRERKIFFGAKQFFKVGFLNGERF